jgi:hypothetical protein
VRGSNLLGLSLSSQPNKLGEARPNKWLPLTPALSPQKSGEREPYAGFSRLNVSLPSSYAKASP